PRSAENVDHARVIINLGTSAPADLQGFLEFRRHKTSHPWNILAMKREGQQLIGYLPKQPAAGKLEYYVHLVKDSQEISLTGDKPVIIRFKGPVPKWLLLAHVLVIFLAMLFSTQSGLMALLHREGYTSLAKWTAVMMFIGGFILGPLMQKFAFGVFWSGFPLGKDLTDTKTLVAMLAWIAALASGRKTQPKRGWVIAASLITLAIFLVPHSLFGSELKW
ncbi:MAG: hypothetical protein H5U07_11295, partial [Candidatus Aminicenantes bacterium]|nr:hypothetical protein [Candidatus Aminicenantes bacterium]